MSCAYYYNSNAILPNEAQIVDKNWVAFYGGIDPETSTPAELAAAGFYCYIEAMPPAFDPKLYSLDTTWVITGTDASQNYTVVELPLATAKENCVSYEQGLSTVETASIATESGYTGDVLTATAALAEPSRPPEIQAVFDAQSAVVTELVATIATINASTSVSELNNIVNPPTGTLRVYRTGITLEESFYVSFNSTTMTEAETELYIPGSTTTVAYAAGVFPQTPAAFPPADFIIQIRESATGQVIAEFECPEVSTDIAF